MPTYVIMFVYKHHTDLMTYTMAALRAYGIMFVYKHHTDLMAYTMAALRAYGIIIKSAYYTNFDNPQNGYYKL